jgi:hypothetical protein
MTKKPKLSYFINFFSKKASFAHLLLECTDSIFVLFISFLSNYPQKCHKSPKNTGYLH